MKVVIGYLTLLLVTLTLGYWCLHEPKESKIVDLYYKYREQTDLFHEPIQEKTSKEIFNFGDYEIEPLYNYALKAKVLRKEKYSFDRSAKLSKYDLALGWKEMAKDENIDKIKITQSNRWYRWKVDNFFIPRTTIEHNSANTHIIHANSEVLEQVESFDKGDVVELYGYLVKIKDKNGFQWKSSTKRTDTGDGACEVFFVEYAKVFEQ